MDYGTVMLLEDTPNIKVSGVSLSGFFSLGVNMAFKLILCSVLRQVSLLLHNMSFTLYKINGKGT